jgi:hypothetical protein
MQAQRKSSGAFVEQVWGKPTNTAEIEQEQTEQNGETELSYFIPGFMVVTIPGCRIAKPNMFGAEPIKFQTCRPGT